MELPESVKVIARAGAGVNNIPVKDCAEKGLGLFDEEYKKSEDLQECDAVLVRSAGHDIQAG